MGNFDGVHLGHQAVLSRLVEVARKAGNTSVVLTFFPHPMAVTAPERRPPLIQTLKDRLDCIERCSPVDMVVVVPFTKGLAATSAVAFVDEVLLGRLRCQDLFIGHDARFGRDREGDIEFLRRCEPRLRLHVLEPIEVAGVRVSSSRIRRLVAAGDVALAQGMLGRPFSLVGPVVRGAGRGRKLGFPTANLAQEGELLPGEGVYACEAEIAQGTFPAAVHVGPVPTFGVEKLVVEAHLVGFEGDLLGQRLRLSFLSRLRPVKTFPDPAVLASQMAEDVRAAVEVFAHWHGRAACIS